MSDGPVRRRWPKCAALCAATMFLVVLARVSHAAPEYRVIPLGNWFPEGLNDLGQTVGTVVRDKQPGEDFGNTSRRYEGFRTEPFTSLTKRDVLGPDDVKKVTSGFAFAVFGSNGGGINDAGQVVGIRQGAGLNGGMYYAYRTEPQARIGEISPGFYVGHQNNGLVTSVNRVGQFVGYTDHVGTIIGTFRSSANGEPDALFPIDSFVPPTLQAIPKGINDSGQVAGYLHGLTGDYAFRTQPNAEINMATDMLGTLGGQKTQSLGINNSGVAVGYSETTTQYLVHAFRSVPGSPIEDLGAFSGGRSLATGINDNGWIVGFSDLDNGLTHAALWRDGQMIDLNTLIDKLLVGPDVAPENTYLAGANAITASGIIWASGAGQQWLLVPVPEPSTWALLAIGLLAATIFAKSVIR